MVFSGKATVLAFMVVMVAAAAAAFVTPVLGAVHNYDVGDNNGWTTTADHYFYDHWAASKTFHVGDIIRFKYNPNYHNVIQVIQSDYSSCGITTPLAVYTTGNDSITIDKSAGTHDYYFICGFSGHCEGGGMKLHIHVQSDDDQATSVEAPAPTVSPPPSSNPPLMGAPSSAPAPAPAPNSLFDAPAPTPTPTPSSSSDHHPHHKNSTAVVHTVGDSLGWTTIGHVDYRKWAAFKTFHFGDIIRFKYNAKYHNVMQVTHGDYRSCNASRPLATYTSGDDSITINKGRHHYFICGVPGHCQSGMSLDIHIPPTLPDLVKKPALTTVSSPPTGGPATATPTISPTVSTPDDSSAFGSLTRVSIFNAGSVFIGTLAAVIFLI